MATISNAHFYSPRFLARHPFSSETTLPGVLVPRKAMQSCYRSVSHLKNTKCEKKKRENLFRDVFSAQCWRKILQSTRKNPNIRAFLHIIIIDLISSLTKVVLTHVG